MTGRCTHKETDSNAIRSKLTRILGATAVTALLSSGLVTVPAVAGEVAATGVVTTTTENHPVEATQADPPLSAALSHDAETDRVTEQSREPTGDQRKPGQLTGNSTATPAPQLASNEDAESVVLDSAVPMISGKEKVGSTLTVDPGTWTAGSQFTYQWFRDDTAISGAKARQYLLVGADAGYKLTVTVTGNLNGHASISETSVGTARIAKGDLKVAKPTITGLKKVAATLTAKPGKWTNETGFKYQWYRSGKAISKAKSSKYKLTAADVGKTISVKVTGSKKGYNSAFSMSAKTSKIAKATLKTGKVAIKGKVAAGTVLAVNPGTWTAGATLKYQWYRSGKAISKAKSSKYKLTAADVGKTISVKVTGSKKGYKSSTKTAAAKWALKSARPAISGTKKVGSKLTVKRGSWSSGVKFKYQWYRNGKHISKATSATYGLKASDVGKRISVKVTATKSGYKTVSKTSAKTSKIVKGTLRASTPTITGTKKVGSKLTVKRGSWSSGVKFKYQWYRNGKAISKAKSSTYVLKPADAGKRISVKVTGTRAGYKTAARTSAKTGAIAKRTLTFAQKKAVEAGREYLRLGFGFSRVSLIEQLIYEGFSTRDATVAVDYISPNWNKQAAISADNYVTYVGGFSKRGLMALHNMGCSLCLKPPVWRRLRVM